MNQIEQQENDWSKVTVVCKYELAIVCECGQELTMLKNETQDSQVKITVMQCEQCTDREFTAGQAHGEMLAEPSN